ncbi:hypothetical protein M8J76_004755 [Diaphorina citri]|nr:hypothetical protein M8J76_004755 [Diaphorina citri]
MIIFGKQFFLQNFLWWGNTKELEDSFSESRYFPSGFRRDKVFYISSSSYTDCHNSSVCVWSFQKMYSFYQILVLLNIFVLIKSQDDEGQMMSPCRMLCLIMHSKQESGKMYKEVGGPCDACRPGQTRAPVRFGKRSDIQLKVRSRTFERSFSPLLSRFQFHFEY